MEGREKKSQVTLSERSPHKVPPMQYRVVGMFTSVAEIMD